MIYFILAWALERAQLLLCAHNMGALFNGFGAIEQTNRRTALAPMAYRVLVPWLIGILEKISTRISRLHYYEGIRIALNMLALWSVKMAFGWEATMVMAILLLPTFKFDYWDWAIEVSSISLAMTGNLALAIPGAILHGLSRETVILAPIAYLLKTGDIVGAAILAAAGLVPLVAVRMYVGKRNLYCKRWMIRENIALVKEFYKWTPIFFSDIMVSLVITALVIAGALVQHNITWLIPLIIMGAGWTMAKADEPRVFSAALPWVAMFICTWR